MQIFAAGFVPDVIWLSEEDPLHGDVVDIYVTVFNGPGENLSGTVRYYDDELLLGEVPVTVPANSAKLVSLSWEAVQGDRVIFARFSSGTNAPEETASLRFKVKKPIVPDATPAPDGEPSEFKDVVVDTGEKAGELATEGFEIAENGRMETNSWLEEKKQGAIENKEEFLSNANSTTDTELVFGAKKLLHSLLVFALGALVFITSAKIVFYAVIILIIYGLIKIIRSRRNAYDDY